MSMQKLVITALEVRRRYSECAAVHVDEQNEVQRQRSSNNSWLDWAAIFLKPMDYLSREQCRALECLHENKLEKMSNQQIHVVTSALDFFESYYEPKPRRVLLRQGYSIADRI